LVVLCDFKGLQDFQTTFGGFQIFSSLSPPFSHIPDAAKPHPAAPRGIVLERARPFAGAWIAGR
jgi:hypothetical protein